MKRTDRLFEVIQILRSSGRPVRAEDLADRLEISARTVYRDIATLQGIGTPIEGEAGVGYIMRRGYDLPPLNFDEEEAEALRVGLSMLARSGDTGLQRAAERVRNKIEALQCPATWIHVSPHGAPDDAPSRGCISLANLRRAIRDEQKLEITYRDVHDIETVRVIRPIAILYHIECNILAAWCELRGGFRHFRTTRIWSCTETGDTFTGKGDLLRNLWEEEGSYNWHPEQPPA